MPTVFRLPCQPYTTRSLCVCGNGWGASTMVRVRVYIQVTLLLVHFVTLLSVDKVLLSEVLYCLSTPVQYTSALHECVLVHMHTPLATTCYLEPHLQSGCPHSPHSYTGRPSPVWSCCGHPTLEQPSCKADSQPRGSMVLTSSLKGEVRWGVEQSVMM